MTDYHLFDAVKLKTLMKYFNQFISEARTFYIETDKKPF